MERHNGLERASDVEAYTTAEIERVARFAFARAAARRRRLASVDKANVLATSALWRKTVERLAADHPQVALSHLYVDNAAMQLILAPEQFDVILTSNLFGDILSDAGAALVGSDPGLGAAPGRAGPRLSPRRHPLGEPDAAGSLRPAAGG